MLRKRNIATAPLLLRAGLSEDGLARAADESNGLHQRVSAVGRCRFLEYAAEAMDESAFGLHLAKQIDPRDVGLYFFMPVRRPAISAKRLRSFPAIAESQTRPFA
jgi:Arabinose-binding domain of AraC transcription regulator, N-term